MQNLLPARKLPLHEPDQSLDLALRERVPGLAQLRLEPDARHERGVVGLPYGPAVDVAPQHHRLHVVGQHALWHPHHRERVDHADEQALLARIGEELHVARAAVVAHHREARDSEHASGPVLDIDESPVHLVGLAGRCGESPAAARLRVGAREPPLRGNQVGMRGDIVLHGGPAALVALAPDALENDLGVGDALREQGVHNALEAADHRRGSAHPAAPVGRDDETSRFQCAGPRSREPRSSREFGQVHLVEFEGIALRPGDIRYGLVYNLLQAIALVVIHGPPCLLAYWRTPV